MTSDIDAVPSEAFEEWASEEGINNFHFNHCWEAWQAALVSAGKPADIDKLFEVLMQQNIVTSEESYLALKCVGVPPTEEEFVRAVQRVLTAAQPASGVDHE